MSLLGSMGSAVSGLQAFNTWMTVIGNNIANVDTTGYKSSTVEFADLFSQTTGAASGPDSGSNLGGINPSQFGLGSKIGAVELNMAQGSLQNTTSPTDLALNGNGLFILKQGNYTSYSSARNFSFG